ncbi:MAG: hypothetical protein ACT4OK_04115 [Gemmobacter sp.]
MSLQTVLQFINIQPGSAGGAFTTQVQNLISTYYQNSWTMRAMLETRVTQGENLTITYVQGKSETFWQAPGPDFIEIDPVYCNGFRSINQYGNTNIRGFEYALLHELIHGLVPGYDTLVNPNTNDAIYDFQGDIVRLENLMVSELGWSDRRVGYFSMSNQYGVTSPAFTVGVEIDYAFRNIYGRQVIDASASMQKDLDGLLVGGSGNESVVGGNGNDWLHGLGGNDSIVGGVGNDKIFGGRGIDDLRGGGGDDFIFFDAADAIIRGGTGRDAAFVSTADAVNINVTNSQIEIVVGGAGNDTLIAGVSPDDQLLAGGDGADVIRLRYGAGEGARVVWGGAGADRFEFVFPGVDPNQTWTNPAGILVVNVAALTALNFASLTLGMLGLGGIDMSEIAAIVVNPDGSDRFFVNGVRIDAALLAADPNLQPDDGGAVFTTRATDWLGPQLMMQAIFEDRWLYTPTPMVHFFELGGPDDDLSEVVNGITVEEGNWGVVWGGAADGSDLLMTLEEAQDYIDAFDTTPYWIEPTDPRPYGPFFVAGGAFNGSALSSGGAFSATAPADAISADWLALG